MIHANNGTLPRSKLKIFECNPIHILHESLLRSTFLGFANAESGNPHAERRMTLKFCD